MADSTRSKKGTTKSPQSSQSSQSSQSPKRKRKRKAAAETKPVDVNNEDYNIRSPKRTQLLTQIKATLGNDDVSPAFWACCQLAHMNRLEVVAALDEDVIRFFVEQVCALPMRWNQRLRDSACSQSEATLQGTEGSKKRKLSSGAQSLPRSEKEANNCKERDDHKCILTKIPDPQAAHIFPYYIQLQPRPKPDRSKSSSAFPEFWKTLNIFWNKDQVNKWKNKIFPNGVGVESCFNLISLSASAHVMWNKGLFALKPLKLSRNQKTLTVQFFWQVPANYEIDSTVDLLTETASSVGLDTVGDGYFLARPRNDLSISRICSGETFTFTTKDPKNQPLPSMELLEMQWILQRLVGMSGAAGWPSLDDIDDDSAENEDDWLVADYTNYGVHNSPKRVREWVDAEEVASMTPEISTATPSMIQCH